MKRVFYLLFFTGLILTAIKLPAQTLVNRIAVDTLSVSAPIPTYNYQTAVYDNSTGLYAAIGIYAGQLESEAGVIHIDTSGNFAWEAVYTYNTQQLNYITNLRYNQGYLYTTGFIADSATGTSSFFTAKLNATNGDTVFTRVYHGSYTAGDDVATNLLIDDTGNIYVCGTEQMSATDYRMTLIKYDNNGNTIWVSGYDSTGLYTGAMGMALNPGSDIVMTGYSGTAYSNYDFCTVWASIGNGGSILSVARTPGISLTGHPTGIMTDEARDAVILGTTTTSSGSVIKLIEYDSAFTQVASQTFGDTNSVTVATGIANDGAAHLVVSGYAANTSGGKDMLVFCINNNQTYFNFAVDTVLWTKRVSASNAAWESSAAAITTDNNGNAIATGRVFNGSKFLMNTVSFSINNGGALQWAKTYSGGGSYDGGTAVFTDGNNSIYGLETSVNTDTLYKLIEYQTQPLSSQVYTDNADNPVYLQGQLIFKIDSSAVNRDAINDTKVNFGNLSTFLKPWAVDSLDNILPSDILKNCQLVRIYSGLKTTYTTSISRLGEPIPIPDLWSTFLLYYNTSAYSELDICNMMQQHYPLIKYAELDLVGTPTSVAPNDLLYSAQLGLYPNSTWPHSDINVEKAWTYTTGNPGIRIGVFDCGVLWTHQDFGYTPANPVSVVKGGYDFFLDEGIFEAPPPNSDNAHGTACAGIIGAVRNNDYAIAGIAGGDTVGIGPGVSLYGFKVIGELLTSPAIPVHVFANAMVQGCLDVPDSSYGYRLHAINNSYAFQSTAQIDSGYLLPDNMNTIREAIRLGYRNKVTLAFGSGDAGFNGIGLLAPASIDNNWILSVGGTGFNGNYEQLYDSSENPLYPFTPNYGYGLDISAPCTNGLVFSLSISTNGAGGWNSFNGTSASCALVTGVVALLQSYLDDSIANYDNLAPEDIEYIIEHTAFTTDTPGYNLLTGWGRLNAGGALYLVDTAQRKLHHFDSDSLHYSTSVAIAGTGELIQLNEQAYNTADTLFLANNYLADVYKVSRIISLPLATTDTIRASWPRPSSSFVYPPLDGSNNLLPHERLTIDTINYSTAIVSGYIYHLYDSATGAPVGWLPMDTVQALTTNFAISVLTGAPIIVTWDSIFDTIPTAIEMVENNGFSIKAYPNAVTDIQELEILLDKPGEQVSVDLYDITGRKIMSIFNGLATGNDVKLNVNLSAIQSGIYFYVVSCSGLSGEELKIIKL